jgi:hypothetical protein
MSLSQQRAGAVGPDCRVIPLEGRRRHPRLALDCPLHLANDAGESWIVQARNISPGGLQVVCDQAIAQRLPERPLNTTCHYPTVLQAGVLLPLAQGQRRLTVGLGLTYWVPVESGERWWLGFGFVALRPVAQRILAGFLATAGTAMAEERPSPR